MLTKSKRKHIGDFKQRVEIERFTTVSDGMGGTTQEWAAVGSVWANIRPLSGQKRLEFGKLGSTVTHEIQMRYRTDITDQDRLMYNGRNFTLKFKINEDEENAFLSFGAASED